MSINVKEVLRAPILRFNTIDSTNNRAAQMIDADKSVPGLTIIAEEQTAGKGQRGNTWKDEPGSSLLMSIVLQPEVTVDEQFSFSAAVAVAVAETIRDFAPSAAVNIKFPNDIIINDKKAAGILIENIFRGSNWAHAIAGIGINIHQRMFNPALPHATSLYQATGREWDREQLMQEVRARVIGYTTGADLTPYLDIYNQILYKKGKQQTLSEEGEPFDARIICAEPNGQLRVQAPDDAFRLLQHGQFRWVW